MVMLNQTEGQVSLWTKTHDKSVGIILLKWEVAAPTKSLKAFEHHFDTIISVV